MLKGDNTMAVKTSNAYGNITIDDEAIACATGHIARECYGVVDLVGQGSVKSKNQLTKGIKIITVGNRIYIDLFAILKYGVSIGTVTDNLKSAVKYGVEQFTGMIVDSVNINVVGKTVVAVKSGTVVTSTALKNPNGTYRSYGEYIIIDQHDGTMTLYAHMYSGSRMVSPGQSVSQGQQIGKVGSTGNSTGNHLHFEVRINGKPVNPTPYLP